MTSKRNWSLLIGLSFVLTLFLLGCVRPMPGDDGALVATSPPPADSGSYPAPAEPQSEAEVQEAYPAEEGYPVEQGQSEQAELMQPESGEEANEAYPATEGEAAAEESAELPASEGEDQAAADEATADETAEGEAAEAAEASEPETAEAEAAEGESTEGEAAQEAPAGDETAQEETTDSETAETGRTHTVAGGETLYSIGMQYGMSWITLAEANDITNPDSLYIGQVLTIPDVETLEETESAEAGEEEPVAEDGEGEAAQTEESEDAAAAEETTYIVQSGDTLLSISYRFGVNMMDIARENELASFDQIYAGQELIIPTAEGETAADQEADSSAASDATTHVVAEGETVFTIAFQYGVTWTKLVEANELASPYTLEAGQTLIIPANE